MKNRNDTQPFSDFLNLNFDKSTIKIEKNMKRILCWIIAGILALGISSCDLDEDSYSLTNMWVGFGMLYINENGGMGYSITLDEGSSIIPVTSNIYLGQFEDSSRVLVNYTILGDESDSTGNQYLVKINSMRDILLKGILDITPATEDSIGNDPIIVQDAWLSGNLLTFELKYYGGNMVHYINLVKQPGELSIENQPIELELRHNDNNDGGTIPYVAYVSFDLSSLIIAGTDSVDIHVTATEFNGEIYSEEGVFQYGDN